MSATLHIFKAALDDLQDALDWYESQSVGLEQRFSKAINERLTFISDHPEASAVRVEGFRGAQLIPYIMIMMIHRTLSLWLPFYTINEIELF